MSRGPKGLRIPTDNLDQMARLLEDHLLRLYEEASDHRNHVFHLQELSHGQSITIGGAPTLNPSRSRRWLELALICNVQFSIASGSGANAPSSLNAKLYNNGVAATDICFDLTVGGTAGAGWKSGTVRLTPATPSVSPSNPGKEIMSPAEAWSIVVAASGGAGNAVIDITLSVTYEDFVPFNANRRTLV